MFYLIPIIIGFFVNTDLYWLCLPFFYGGIFICGLMIDGSNP